MSAKWYYAKDNKPIGPFTSEEMKQLYNEQTIHDATFVWKEGAPDWKFYKETDLSMDSVVPEVPEEEETVVLMEDVTENVEPSSEKPNDTHKAKWYYLKGVTPQGPFTKEEMLALYESGEISNKTMVLSGEEENWSSFKESSLFIPKAKVELMPDKTENISVEEDKDGATEVYSDETAMEPYEYDAFDDFTENPEEVEEWYIDEDGPYTLRALRSIYKRGNISSSSVITKADGTPISMELLKDEIRQPEIKKDQWFVAKNGQPDGPYDSTDLVNKVISGEISPDTLIWKDGMKDWIKIIDSSLLSQQQKEIFQPKKETKPKKSKLPMILGLLVGLCAIGAIGFFFFGHTEEDISSSSFTGNWKLSKYAPADGDFWDLSLSDVQKLRMTVDYDGDLTIRTNGRDIYVGTWTVEGSKADIEGSLNDEDAQLELTVNEDGEVVIKQKPDVTLIFVEDLDAPLVEESETKPETEEPAQAPSVNPDAGTYRLNYDMNLRSEPNRGSSDVGDMKAGSTVSIVEINENSDGKWGKTSDGKWICISDANYTYLTKQ